MQPCGRPRGSERGRRVVARGVAGGLEVVGGSQEEGLVDV
jgi:hypothetical protein